MHPFPNIVPDRHHGLAGMTVTCEGVQVKYRFEYDQRPQEPVTPDVLKKPRTKGQGPRGQRDSPLTPCPVPASNFARSTEKPKDTPPGFRSIPVARKLSFSSGTPLETPSGAGE